MLAGEFPAADEGRWLAAVAGALDRNGGLAPAEALARLRSTTYDGITVEPLYTAADAPRGRTAPVPTRAGDGWDVRQLVVAAGGERRALAELERGATSILLDVTGLSTIDADVVGAVLDGVLLDLAPVALMAGGRWTAAADAFVAHLDASGIDATAGAGSLGADPIGVAAMDGGTPAPGELDAVAAWIERLGGDRPGLRVATIDGTRYHDAGASDGQELGCTIAAAVELLRALDARGIDAASAIPRLELRLAATADQFATIAKFRAARALWARVAEAVGCPGAAAATPIHAITSTAMMTAYDPWVNALRSTVACFAAGVAGADAVTVLPHDHLRGAEATELGRRIGRNTQSILLHESHLGAVADPAGGSWYVETFTDELADAAWTCFQQIEAAGGLLAAATTGLVAEQLAVTGATRQHDIDTRRAPLTGVTEFPDIAEPSPSDTAVATPGRWAGRIEELRRRVDRATSARGDRPAVFLATIGNPATFTPRYTFAKNLFEVGGLATIAGPVSDDPAEIAHAFTTFGATVACLCSSDGVYAEQAADVAKALTTAAAEAVYIAGKPQAGIERSVAVGSDVYEILAGLLDLLQVP